MLPGVAVTSNPYLSLASGRPCIAVTLAVPFANERSVIGVELDWSAAGSAVACGGVAVCFFADAEACAAGLHVLLVLIMLMRQPASHATTQPRSQATRPISNRP